MLAAMLGVDVEIPRANESARAMPGFAALPEGAERGVVVLHEIYGRQPEIDRVVERLADAGYAAVEPDIFYEGSMLGCISRAVLTTATGEGPIAERIEDARRWLCAQAELDSARVGVIGFCLGGGLALAVGPKGYGAVSTNYGEIPPLKVLRGSPPVIGCYGGRDRSFRGNAKRLPKRLAKVGVEAEAHLFPTVGHSFLTDGDHPAARVATWPLMRITWDPEVAAEGWEKILAFFDRTL